MNALNRKVILIAVIAVIVGSAGYVLWRRNGGDSPGGNILLEGNGTIETTEVELASKLGGRLKEVSVKEGEKVAAGGIVAVIDAGDLEGLVEQAAGNLKAAEAALAELKAGTRREEVDRLSAQREASRKMLAQAEARLALIKAGPRSEQIEQFKANLAQSQANLTDAEREYERMGKLTAQGALPERDLDQAGTRRDVARAQVDAARQILAQAQAGARAEELREAEAAAAAAAAQATAAGAALNLALSGPRPETITAAEARVEQARGALRAARYHLDQTVITALSSGVVTLRAAEPGETVSPGQPIVKLADLENVWLRVYISEKNVGWVKLGQKAEVTTDTRAGKKYQGRVIEIAEKPEFTPKNVQTKEERVKLVFGVKIGLVNPDRELKPGMPADAVIYTEEAR